MAYGPAVADLHCVRDRDPDDRFLETPRYHGVRSLRLLRQRRQPDAPIPGIAWFKADDRFWLQLRPTPNFDRANLVHTYRPDADRVPGTDDRVRSCDCVGDSKNRRHPSIQRYQPRADGNYVGICSASDLSVPCTGDRGGAAILCAGGAIGWEAPPGPRFRERGCFYEAWYGIRIFSRADRPRVQESARRARGDAGTTRDCSGCRDLDRD